MKINIVDGAFTLDNDTVCVTQDMTGEVTAFKDVPTLVAGRFRSSTPCIVITRTVCAPTKPLRLDPTEGELHIVEGILLQKKDVTQRITLPPSESATAVSKPAAVSGGKSLYYHTKLHYEALLETDKRAHRLQLGGVPFWVPLALCRAHKEHERTIYVWTEWLTQNLPEPAYKQTPPAIDQIIVSPAGGVIKRAEYVPILTKLLSERMGVPMHQIRITTERGNIRYTVVTS